MSITVAELVARLRADTSGYHTEMDRAAGKAEETSSKGKASFGTFFGAVNRTGALGPFGEGLALMDEGIQRLGEHAKGIGPAIQGAGVAIMGVGGLLAALGSKDEAAQKQLKLAIEGTGAAWEEYKPKIEGAIASQAKFGRDAVQTQDALRILTTATGNTDDALKALSAASDLAAFRHISLSEAATGLAKTHDGSARALKGLGLEIEKAGGNAKTYAKEQAGAEKADIAVTQAKEKLQQLEDRLATSHASTAVKADQLKVAHEKLAIATQTAEDAHKKLSDTTLVATGTEQAFMDNVKKVTDRLQGQDAAAVDTFGGKIKVLATQAENAAAQFGVKYGPALMGVGALMTALPAVIGLVSTAFGVLGGVVTFLLSPIGLIILAVAAIGVALYLVWTRWDTIWGWIKDAIGVAREWIDRHIVLIAVLFGPGALLIKGIEFIADRWGTIWGGVKTVIQDVWNFIKPILDTMGKAIGAVSGPLGTVLGAAGKVGGAIGGIFGFAEGGVVPGPQGKAQLAVVHGGETIFPVGSSPVGFAASSASGGGLTYNINVNVPIGANMADAGRAMVDAIKVYEQRSGKTWRG